MRRKVLFVSAFCALTACDGHRAHGEEEKGRDDHVHGSSTPHKHDHERGERTLHVDESMLRDLHLSVLPAEARVSGDVITALGELSVNEERYAEVGTPIAAKVTRLFAAEGDDVEKGAPLVELDSIEVGKARAATAAAEARVRLARETLARKRALLDEQLTAGREVHAAEAELAEAEAALKGAQTTLRALGSARGESGRFLLASPISGTVLERNALLGRRVDDQVPLFIVADLARLWLIVRAFERDALGIKPGARAEVDFAALPGRTFEGSVTRIGSRVDAVSRTVEVRVELDNPEKLLKPGMSATARIARGDAQDTLVAVPTQAVQRMADGWVVFIPEAAPGDFEIREVGRGRDLGGQVEIVTGLRAGEKVVVDGAFLLKAQFEKTRGRGAEHHH